MLKQLIMQFKNMEINIKKILHNGCVFSLFVGIISMLLLLTYHITLNLELYYIGLAMLRLSLFFVIEFIISAIAIDTIRKQVT